MAASTYGLGICDERIAEEASRKLKELHPLIGKVTFILNSRLHSSD